MCYLMLLYPMQYAFDLASCIGAVSENIWVDAGLDNCKENGLNHVYIASAGENMIRAEGFFVDIFKFTYAAGD